MKLAHNSMYDILYLQRQATLLAALKEPTTSPALAKALGDTSRHITHKLRRLEAAGKVVVVGQPCGRGGALVWRRI